MFISAVILGGAYVLLYYWLSHLVPSSSIEAWYWRVVYYVAVFVIIVLMLFVFFFLFNRIASALAAPFNDVISRKTEEIVRGSLTEERFSIIQLVKDSGRAVAHSFRILAVYIGLLLAALLLLLIPGIGPLLFSSAAALLSSYMFAFEYLGYPMDRRRFSFSQKRKFLRSQFTSAMGFGLGNLAVASIPVLNLFFIPAAVAGGTLLFLDLDDATPIDSSFGMR